MGPAFADLDGSGSSVNKRALLDFSDLVVYNSVDVQMVEFAVTLMGLVLVLRVGLDSFAMRDAEKDSLVMDVMKYVNARMMVHAITSMVHVLVKRDGLDQDVTNHALLVRSELGVHRNAYVKTEHTVIRQMEPALVHQVGWGKSVM